MQMLREAGVAMRPRGNPQSRIGRVLHVLGQVTKLGEGEEAKTTK